MTYLDPTVRLAIQLFYGSAATLAFYLKKGIKDVTIVGNNLPAFLARAILQQNGFKITLLHPLCEKEDLYTIKSSSKELIEYPLLGSTFRRSSFEFFTSLLRKEDIQKLVQHTGFDNSKLERMMDELITRGDNFLEKDSGGKEWFSFSSDLRNKENFSFSSLYHCILEDVSTKETTPDLFRIDIKKLRYKKCPNRSYIAIYEGDSLLFLTKKLIFCNADDLRRSDTIVGDYIHQENFTELGYHFSCGELGGHNVSLLHEGKDLWIRIVSELFHVQENEGLCEVKKKTFQPHQILQYFETPEKDLLIDPYLFTLFNPRPFSTENSVYYLHPFHLPKTQQPWLTILILSLLIAHN